jgi:hypothetical protein
VLAEQEGATVISPSQVDGFLWNARLQPSAYDQSTMSAISAGLHAPLVVWAKSISSRPTISTGLFRQHPLMSR